LDFKDEPGSAALYISGMAFSAVHVAAWNWQFPSRTVQVLWRVASLSALLSSAFPLIIGFSLIFSYTILLREGTRVNTFYDSVENQIDYVINNSAIFLSSAAIIVYVVCRIIILFLTFYCFSSMPSSVYEKLDWTGYVPHFS
jgi:hypothetical protein